MIAILFATVSLTACGSSASNQVTEDSTNAGKLLNADTTLVVDSASVGSAVTDGTSYIK